MARRMAGILASMGWAFVYMFVILKIPVVAAIWLVWWAAKQVPEEAPGNPGSGSRRDHPRPRPPRPPRRGPHGGHAAPSPPRVRRRVAPADRMHRA